MKRWYDYTDEELLEIHGDPEAFAKLLDLECAYEGAPLMPEDPGPKPEVCAAQHDVTLYAVGGINVDNPEDAARFGKNGIELVRNVYNWNHEEIKLYELYSKLLT